MVEDCIDDRSGGMPGDGAEGAADAVLRPTGYASPSIVARRKRILEETRTLVSEVGLHGLSLDDVARRAGVAKRTIYNAFQSKEHLVATAITRFFEDYGNQIRHHTDPATLEGLIDRLVASGRRLRVTREYGRAMLSIYFASNVDLEIRRAIRNVAADTHEAYVRELHRSRNLQSWMPAERLVETLICLRYATMHAWLEGLIAEDDLEQEIVRGCLSLLAGATRGKAHRAISAALCGTENMHGGEAASPSASESEGTPGDTPEDAAQDASTPGNMMTPA